VRMRSAVRCNGADCWRNKGAITLTCDGRTLLLMILTDVLGANTCLSDGIRLQ
jgi:hypothetical protein